MDFLRVIFLEWAFEGHLCVLLSLCLRDEEIIIISQAQRHC